MQPDSPRSEIIERFARYVQAPKARFWQSLGLDIVMGRREGIYFWDENGRRYINCHCNGGVFNLGHRNPEVMAALQEGLNTYDIGNHHLISRPRALLAEKLVASFGKGPQGETLDKVIFGVSGGEAVDLAIKMARGYTRRQTILSLKGGYHGHTGFAVETASQHTRDLFNLHQSRFKQVPVEALERLEDFIDTDTAAFILETAPATLGFYVIPQATMQHIREVCTQRGVVFIIDEVQTGLGRTGKNWGFQHYNLMPDMLVAGKGLSGGVYPMAITAFRAEYEALFAQSPFAHVSTMGGSEVGCLVTSKVLDISTDPDFLAHVNGLADFFRKEILRLQAETGMILDLRQLGLAMGIVFRDPLTCIAALSRCYANGLYPFFSGYDLRVMQFKPPLITSLEQAKEIVELLEKSITEVSPELSQALGQALQGLPLEL